MTLHKKLALGAFALLGLGIAGALSIVWAFHTFQKRLSA